ncbi:MAG: yiaD [Phycisphaerales bacterium]|nr:yiaD [Phycisphaerales bacterium]
MGSVAFLGGRSGGKRTAFRGAALGAVVLVAGAGCQNKMKDENDRLWQQNRELQARIDERNSMKSQEAPIAPPEPAKAPEPSVKAPDPVKPPAEPTAFKPAPTPPPAPTPTDLGGEVSVDPVAGTTTVNFLGDALFDSGKATVKESAKANLNKLVAALKAQYAGKTVKVQGHSDSDPIKVSKWKSNQELSEARAKAVRDYLASKGVPAAQLSAEGFGDAKPKSATDKSKNRRVEIVVLTK